MSACFDDNALNITDCWNRIGVWGSQSPRCEQLDKVIHCRNCDVYSAFGRKILQRHVSDDMLSDATRNLSTPVTRKNVETDTGLIFRLCDEWLMLDTKRIQEITPRTTIHRLPHHTDRLLLGLANVRGELKICVNLARLLEIDTSRQAANDDKQRIYPRMLVAGKAGDEFVFPVDEVAGTRRYNQNDLQPAPATVTKASTNFVSGVLDTQDRHIACLDEELLFYAIGRNLL